MSVLGIIPARYASTRFPGKPLAEIQGKSMIRRVYERAVSANVLNEVIVATDDDRIKEHVESWGGKVVMTSPEHESGTERCLEALETWSEIRKKKWKAVINIQGDEPFIDPEQIRQVARLLEIKAPIATLAKKITDPGELFSPDAVKVVINENRQALLFSRSPIPFVRGAEKDQWLAAYTFYKHVGIYGYQVSVLEQITRLSAVEAEKAESLEQLRWLVHGYRIFLALTDKENIAIDTPGDLLKIANIT